MNFIKSVILFSFFILINSATFAVDSLSEFTVDGMVGKQPIKLCWIIKQLLAGKPIPKRCLLLHGKPGNGKTTIAKKIAELTQSVFMELKGPSIVQSYIGTGTANIAELFLKAQELIKSSAGALNVIIFIDEIDAIASNNTTEFRTEHKAALQQLWLELDEIKNNQNIFVVFATNHLDKLDKTFLDRFGGNVIEIKNPDAAMRKQILEHYFDQAEIKLKPTLINQLVKKSDGLSNRALEDFVSDARMMADVSANGVVNDTLIWNCLKQTKSKFIKTDDPDAEKKLQKQSTYLGMVHNVIGSTMSLIYFGIYLGILNEKANLPDKLGWFKSKII